MAEHFGFHALFDCAYDMDHVSEINYCYYKCSLWVNKQI